MILPPVHIGDEESTSLVARKDTFPSSAEAIMRLQQSEGGMENFVPKRLQVWTIPT